ncbi:hypothetical protein Nepgr_025594 [Nepenthes gracilis]|uniref:Syntaxin 6/10/61 N-terminal domain-containing protein n=1 Tax=Nepenthes gracilis TaxID=150966 RepID=A0AAD3T824_NEPGR|nr:hypothetical protein Nepgr_025594 [Nepenthes gracilis]
MATHFDRWEKDPFFSEAEEVQESADRMESTYRTWIHSMKDTSGAWNAEELRRDLRTALGTTKWQLEEFQRAVRSSYNNYNDAQEAKDRHRQFILALDDKISSVENSLQNSAVSDGKVPSPWVRLDEGECDELALFLSGASIPEDSLVIKVIDTDEKQSGQQMMDSRLVSGGLKNECQGSLQQLMHGKDEKVYGHRRTASANADIGSWKIMVAEDGFSQISSHGQVETTPRRVPSFSGFIGTMESASMLKFPKNGFRKWKAADHQQEDDTALLRSQQLNKGVNPCCERSKSCLDSCDDCYNDKQLYSWHGAIQRLLQRSQYQVQYSRPLQVVFWIVLLLLSIAVFMLRVI